VITTATVVASVLGYVLLTVVGRWGLTPAEFGLFLVFWGVLFGIGGALATTEQEAARRAATGDETSRPTVGAVMIAAALLAAVAAGLTLVPFVSRRLYGGYEPGIAFIVLAAVIGFAIQFAVRGTLIGSGSIRSYAAIVIAEAAIRLVVLAILGITVGLTPVSTAVAVASGSLVWLFWFRRFSSIVATVAQGSVELRAAVGRAASLMGGAALLASVVTGYPTMVTLFSGETPGPAGGAAFAALTISRVPLVFIVPIQALTVPLVVSWRSDAAADGGARIRRLLMKGTLAALAVAVLGGAIAWPLGPGLVRFVYGPAYVVSPWVVAVLIVSAILLGWVALVSAALIALSAIRRMVLLWLAVAATTAIWLAVSPLGVVETTAVGTLVGPVVGIACGVPMLWSSALAAIRERTDFSTEGVGG
jgi:O-antigen/teichoic acid export membrane protein